jgi:hypothetical protein
VSSPYSVGSAGGNIVSGEGLDLDGNGYPGSAYLFPLKSHLDPDLAEAINAVFYDDIARWPYGPKVAGSALPVPTQMRNAVDCALVVNWMAHSARHWVAPFQQAPDTDAAGTIPYVNPANQADPEFAYAVNYLIDNPSTFF